MKMRIFIGSLLLCLLLVSALGTLEAQNKRTGTAAATELLIPIGARDIARGGSALAVTSGPEAIFWNPAGVGNMTHSAEGMFSTMSYIGDINVSFGAVAMKFEGFGTVGLSVKSLDFGSIPLTTEDDPENSFGRTFSPAYLTVGLTYSKDLTDAVAAGFNLKLVSEQIDRASSSGLAIDLGIQYNRLLGINGFHLGVAVKNIGPGMKFDGPGLYRDALPIDGRRPIQKLKSEAGTFELPSTVEIGLAYDATLANNVMGTLSGSFTNNNLYLDEYNVGGEVSYALTNLKLFGRAGVGLVPEADTNIFGATFGLGLNWQATGVDVVIDYAYRQVEFFDANNVFSVKLGF